MIDIDAEDWTSISIFNHDSSYFIFIFLVVEKESKMTQANWEHKVLINAMDMSKSHNNFIIFLD